MRTMRAEAMGGGTPTDLIDAADAGARLSARARRATGQGDDAIRRAILGRLADDLRTESYGAYADETIMATVQRAVEAVLAGPRPGR